MKKLYTLGEASKIVTTINRFCSNVFAYIEKDKLTNCYFVQIETI